MTDSASLSGPQLNEQRAIELEQWLLEGWDSPLFKSWRVDNLDVWPLFSRALNTIALEYFLSGRKPMVMSAVGKVFLVARSLLGEWVVQFPNARGGKQASLPAVPEGAVIFVATESASRKIGDITLCQTTDALRLGLRDQGIPTCLWLCDASADSVSVIENYLGGTFGVAGALMAVRRNRFDSAKQLDRLPGVGAWISEAAEKFGVGSAMLRLWLVRILDHTRGYKNLFHAFLETNNPRAIVLTDHGDALTSALCAAARESEIPIYCIQHGALRRTDQEHPLHPYAERRFNTEPEVHLVWRLHALRGSAQAFGPPIHHLDVMAGKQSESSFGIGAEFARSVAASTAVLDTHMPIDGAVQYVLAATQSAQDTGWLVALLGGLDGGKALVWRPHPRLLANRSLMRETMALLEQTGKSWMRLDDIPLPALIGRCDLVVTGYSAVGLEATTMGCRVLFMSAYADWIFPGQIPDGMMTCVGQGGLMMAIEVRDQLRKSAECGDAPNTHSDLDHAFSAIVAYFADLSVPAEGTT